MGAKMSRKIEFKHTDYPPISLHDKKVDSITISGDSVVLHFLETDELERLEVAGVDMDFALVNLQSPFGHFGLYRGEKFFLQDFLEQHPAFTFEIVDELYAYNQVWYCGYIRFPGKPVLREVEISLYFTGNITYTKKEV